MAKNAGKDLLDAFFYGVALWVVSLWTAFFIMILEGIVAPMYDLPTIGYWQAYFSVMLLTAIGGVFTRDTSYFLMKVKDTLDK